jgi:predicted enzyme related to lactoylglutathione lyase
LFVRVEDFNAAYARVVTAGVTFLDAPREETYGRVAVFLDFERNRWELLGSGLPA